MYGITINGKRCDLPIKVTKQTDYMCISLSADMDYSNIATVEFDYFGELATNCDEGYFVFPRADTTRTRYL